jgi:hypothetical protein
VAKKDRLERQARDGILAMAARFAPVPAPYFLAADPELLPQL